MKIRTFYMLSNDVYRVSIYTEDWSEGDRELMQKYGEPQIDLGGTFTGTTPHFTLPSVLKNIMSESPFGHGFDYRDTTDAKNQANAWAAEIANRITDAVDTLRNNTDSYTKEEVIVV